MVHEVGLIHRIGMYAKTGTSQNWYLGPNLRTVLLGLSHLCSRLWARLGAGALRLLYFLSFYNRPDSLIRMPL